MKRTRIRRLTHFDVAPSGVAILIKPTRFEIGLDELLVAAVSAAALKAAGARMLGSISTSKKAAAAQLNGKRGGRPPRDAAKWRGI